MHRKFEESPVTEDDINEVKGEISTMRYEMLEVFERNGMDVSSADRKEKSKLWQRVHSYVESRLKVGKFKGRKLVIGILIRFNYY